MQTETERLEGNLVKLTIRVPADHVERAVKAAYKNVSNEMKIPGFRAGHVPPRVVDNYVGRDKVLGQAQEVIVQETYSKAVDSAGLSPIDHPEMGELDLPVEGEEYVYEAEVPIRPELELSSHEGIKIEVLPKEVADDEIEAEVDKKRRELATLEVSEEGIGEDDFALISFTGLVDGEAYPGNVVERYLYEFGTGQMPGDFENQLLGAKADEKVEVSFIIPETTSNPKYVGKTGVFDVEVHEVKKRVLPEADDDFAQAAGYATIDEMRSKIREEMERGKSFRYSREVEVTARNGLAANLEGDIPEQMVRRRTSDMIRDFFNMLEQQGISAHEYTRQRDLSLEDLEKQFELDADKGVRGELALEALFRTLGYELTDEDIDAELSDFATEDRSSEDVRASLEEAGVMQVIRQQAMHRKATMWLLDNIEVVETDEPNNPWDVADEPEEAAEAADEATDESAETEEETEE